MEDKKLTIGLFVDAFYPMIDGVILVVDQYAKLLSENANVIVFAPTSRERHYHDNRMYRVVRSRHIRVPFTSYDISVPFLDFHFRAQLRNSKLDIVHIHSPFTMGETGIEYAKKHKIPVVGTLHSQYKKDFIEHTKSEIISELMLTRIMNIFNKCDELWAVNQKISEIYNSYGTNTMPKVQQNATDLVPFTDLQKIEALRKKYEIKADEKVFLFVGRIDKIKNLDFTVDSLFKLRLKGFKFKMLFVGSGPYEDELKARIKKFGLDPYCTLVGRITDRIELSSYFKLADLFLFPSLYDASSLVQIEAASQKTPSLFIKDAATAATITPDVNGYVAEDDPSLYALKIIEIFKNPKSHQKVCNQAYQDLYKTWDEVTKNVYKNYLKLIKSNQTKQLVAPKQV